MNYELVVCGIILLQNDYQEGKRNLQKSMDTRAGMSPVSLLTSAYRDLHTLQLMQLITAAIVTKEPQKSIYT